MRVKLKKISTKSFILIFSTINIIAGFLLGAVVTVVAITAPAEQNFGAGGAFAIIIFPLINGLLGAVSGTFLCGMYNFLSDIFGGAEFEIEELGN